MKKMIFAAALVALAACKKTEGTTANAGTDAGKVTTGTAAVEKQTSEELDKIDVEKLKTATPATQAQLESVLPATVGGLPKSEKMGASMAPKQAAMATYMNGTDMSKMYTVMVIDAAGSDASKYQEQFEKYKNSEFAKEASKNSELSSEVINGNRVFFNEMKMGGVQAVGANMLAKGRYAIVVSGSGLTKDMAKDVISKLDLSKLP